MATEVNTVRGPVPVASLGRTLMHEHFCFGYPGYEGDASVWEDDDPDRGFRSSSAALQEAKRTGFSSAFDATPNDCGRNPEFLRDLAEANDFNLICSTGYYYEGEGAPAYFKFRSLFANPADEIAELMVRELTVGIRRTGIKAGVIKLGTSEGQITPYEAMCIQAAAKAQQETGAPIITHTQSGTMGPQQAELLLESGADPRRTIIGHMCGAADDLDYQLATLKQGVGIGFDRIGSNKMFNTITDDLRLDTLVELIRRGYHDRIFMSHDTVNNWLGRDASGFNNLPPMEHWRINRIGDYMIPGLKQRGLSEADIDQIFVANIAALWS